MFEDFRPDVLNPPAVERVAFDEQRAITEIRAAVGQRDEAKGEYRHAVLAIGRKLIEARRAMPGKMRPVGSETFSAAFLAFIEKTGLAKQTAYAYMSYARDPRRLEKTIVRDRSRNRVQQRRCVLEEVRDLLAKAPDLQTAVAVIEDELNETK